MFRYLILLFFFPVFLYAQETDSSSSVLEDVTIKSYEQNRKLRDVPAAINYINATVFGRFDPTSIVQAVNSTPGVRLEERSPGSYRVNIRGSSLRSPFGVRNVKVYFNEIPITDPGGQTYFNQLGPYNFSSLEIIKGPGSSMYGAGTGGVIIIEGNSALDKPSLTTEYTTGSYGLSNIYGSIITGSGNALNKISYQRQELDGYRKHSKMQRDVFNWNGNFRFNDKQALKTTFLWGNLFYQTPGALTKSEFIINPRAARGGNAFFPGAEAANASVTQKMFLAGASYQHQLSSNWQNISVLYGMFTELRNPTIQNFGRSSDPHFGGRTVFKFQKPFLQGLFSFNAGAELQRGFTTVSIFKNKGGTPDSLRSYDEINNRQSLFFLQTNVDVKSWVFTGGVSINYLKIAFERFSPSSPGIQNKNFINQFAPRVAIMKKFQNVNLYSSISKGFSPPTTSELLPTGGNINTELNAEEGWNYDVGAKGNLTKFFSFDVNVFYFSLHNNIVQRRTAGGGDFFVNAGRTSQKGIESSLNYYFKISEKFSRSNFWVNHTYHNFIYKDFKQLNNDFSGNKIPAVANHTLAVGIDIALLKYFSGAISYYYSGKIPLNDANTEFARDYHLGIVKAGFEKMVAKNFTFKFSAGINNLFNQLYSLGNDVNGFGGRYFNVATGRNFFITVRLKKDFKK